MNGADVASEEYERLALEILAVEAGDFGEVKDAIREIIASAPDEADVAFLLSRALAHAGDQALRSEAPVLLSGNQEALNRRGLLLSESGPPWSNVEWRVAAQCGQEPKGAPNGTLTCSSPNRSHCCREPPM